MSTTAPAVPCLLGRGADGRPQFRRGVGAVLGPRWDAEVIIVIGANPTINHPVAATFLKNAAKRGAKLIVMDPRRQTLSRHAHLHLAFKPAATSRC